VRVCANLPRVFVIKLHFGHCILVLVTNDVGIIYSRGVGMPVCIFKINILQSCCLLIDTVE